MRARLATATTHSGGSSEPDMKAFAVMPRMPPSWRAVITVTPVTKRPITRRNTCGCISRRIFTSMFDRLPPAPTARRLSERLFTAP